ncbi:YpoC family protein [Scopulibacillus cellulosilyticus]|uniref:YpoC family protein n=1 Tax=Scopulibacillus cellulosilyticus TaxID=2665665 RepID=A0ABW2PTC1_9BACL
MSNEPLVITVPSMFCFPPFYEKGDMLYIDKCNFGLCTEKLAQPFFYDILYESKVSNSKLWPWQFKESCSILLKQWDSRKEEISGLLRRRNQQRAREPMCRSIANFIDLMFWMHHIPVKFEHEITDSFSLLSYRPINVEERLKFILERPDHYLSFVQLNELYTECGKKMIVKQAREKK